MRGLKKLVHALIKEELNSNFILRLSNNQVTTHLVVVPKKKEIRINIEYLKAHKSSIKSIVAKARELLFEEKERVHYYRFEEI